MKAAKFNDSKLYKGRHLPFANEDEVQDLVETYVKNKGLTVISSAKPGGGRLCNIDVLAVDKVNTPYIIECKWDQIDARAMAQLRGYRKALKADWSFFLELLEKKKGRQAARQWREPVLIAIGYRYHPSVLKKEKSIICLTYSYGPVTDYTYRPATPKLRVVKPRRRGEVSIQRADPKLIPTSPHPKVCKKRFTMNRVACFSPELRKAFRKIHHSLCRLQPVWVMYGGKGLVRYQVSRGVFAEATIGIDKQSIHWRYRKDGRWKVDAQEHSGEMLKACCIEHARLTSAKALS